MLTVIETAGFIKKAKRIMSSEEKSQVINCIAADPEAGDIIPKTGGVRKLRLARKGEGKSGSFRVIYYYYNPDNPIFLFSVYGKNEKSNISDAERNTLYKITREIKKELKS